MPGPIAVARQVDSCDVASPLGRVAAVNRRMIRPPEMACIAIEVDRGNNGCDLIPHFRRDGRDAGGRGQFSADGLHGASLRAGAAHRSLETMRRRPASEVPLLICGMALYVLGSIRAGRGVPTRTASEVCAFGAGRAIFRTEQRLLIEQGERGRMWPTCRGTDLRL